jgi:hypothetical protein
MSDTAVIELSKMSADEAEQFVSKQVIYVNDSNNGSYSGGQITFDLSSLANSGRYIDWSEATLQVPIVFGYKFTSDESAITQGPFGISWKNGWHHIINSMEVMFGNTSVSQLTPFTNVHTSFKMMTTFCQDQAHKFGALLNFFPDSAFSYRYEASASVYGRYVSNNNVVRDDGAYAVATFPSPHNDGLLKRMYNTNIPVDSLPSWASSWSASNLTAIGKSTLRRSGSGVAQVRYVEAIATIRLKDVSDFFAKLGLCKGAFIKITLNTNTSIVKSDIGASNALDLLPADITLQGQTTPFMLASVQVAGSTPAWTGTKSSLGAAVGEAGSGQDIIAGCGISALTLPGASEVKNSLLSTCRVYAPAYLMTSEAEQAFLSEFPTRDIVYNDLYQYTIRGVAPNTQFTQLISNAIVAPQYLLVVPLLAASEMGNISPLASPFSSEPATTSAGLAIGQYNVQLSGSNVYMSNQQYDFEAFKDELVRINAVNGAHTDGMSSGLIGFDEWSCCYRYYVTDLSRGQPMDGLVPKSVQVIGTNISSKTVDYLSFVVYKRKITIRTIDSTIVA